ncbi:MAG: hypothetical protein Q9170_000899 [Blastenia crenularia]
MDTPQRTIPTAAGDGFTSDEVEATIRPTLHTWTSPHHFEATQVNKLVSESKPVCLVGRLVNFYEPPAPKSMPYSAKGCLKVLMRDETGVMMIKLWYSNVDYQLRLGQLVSLWTSRVFVVDSAGFRSSILPSASYVTSIFPEHENSCYFMVQANQDQGTLFKKPLGYKDGIQLDSLMTLESFVKGGHDVINGKVLVCVKSIVTTKQGDLLDIVNVNIFDDTYDSTLSLCGRVAKSAAYWKATQTILLLSNPGFKADKKPTLCVNSRTHIDVDPCMPDAKWLKDFAESLTAREAVRVLYPEGVFDSTAAATAEEKVLFTLSELDE